MKKTIISILKIIIPLGIGIYLTWFFINNLSDVELQNLKNAFFKADYSFMIYGVLITLASHMSRSYRWKYMLESLGHKPKFWKMYHSVMIGYILNLTIPRSGEVARAGYYSKHQKNAPFDKVFGTIVVERVIDVLMLGLVMGVTLFLQKDLDAFNAIKDNESIESSIPVWAYYVVGGIFALGIVLILLIKPLKEKVIGFIKGILEGVKTIFKLKQRVAYIMHTFFIWFCYLLMIWVCSFALPETSGLSVAAVFAIFAIGGVAMSTTPGGIGLYPIMVSAALTTLYGVENAESFAILAWAALTVFTILAGLISLVALPLISKKDND